jgi:glycosyltransferase involved in cell wall biosynthesis
MSPGPELAAVIPARNAASTLGRALSSLTGLDRLAEVIVVDDGSTDETQAVARAAADRLPIRVVAAAGAEPASPGGARNVGIAASSAAVLLFLDADDWREPQAPDPRWAAIDEGADIAVGMVQCHGPDGDPLGPPFRAFLNGSAFITRAAFDSVGAYLVGNGRGEDVEWYLRARDVVPAFQWLDEVVLHYQLGHDSLTGAPGARAHSLLAGLHATIERRRR